MGNQGFNNQNNRGCQCDYSLRSGTRTGTPTARASAETTRGGPGATPPAGATTVETCRARRGIQTTPGPTRLAATKDDDECELCNYLILLTCEIHNICGYICQD